MKLYDLCEGLWLEFQLMHPLSLNLVSMRNILQKKKKYWWNKLQNIFTIYNEEDGIEHQDYRLLDRYYKWAFISSISLFTVFTKISK